MVTTPAVATACSIDPHARVSDGCIPCTAAMSRSTCITLEGVLSEVCFFFDGRPP